jgi:aminocarboxymuconate-semialdehyde decarboxylase
MADQKSIDVHAHILTEEMIARLGKESPRVAPKLIKQPDGSFIMEIAGKVVQNPMPPEIWDIGLRLRDMDANDVDMQVLSNNVATFFYGEEPKLALATSALQNDIIAATVAAQPERFLGIGTLPLQAPQLAADELRRSMRQLGLRGAQIGSNIEDRNLDDPALDPVWAAADELGAFMLVHPHGANVPGRLDNYYMRNFVGLTFETTVAGACLVFGGVLERFPNIKFCLCHAGGYVPYQSGRFVHAWDVRPEAKKRLKGHPNESLARLYFDTITHSKPVLEFLISRVGPERVLLGSDYPFDMGNLDCVAKVRAIDVPADVRATVLGRQAAKILEGAGQRG